MGEFPTRFVVLAPTGFASRLRYLRCSAGRWIDGNWLPATSEDLERFAFAPSPFSLLRRKTLRDRCPILMANSSPFPFPPAILWGQFKRSRQPAQTGLGRRSRPRDRSACEHSSPCRMLGRQSGSLPSWLPAISPPSREADRQQSLFPGTGAYRALRSFFAYQAVTGLPLATIYNRRFIDEPHIWNREKHSCRNGNGISPPTR